MPGKVIPAPWRFSEYLGTSVLGYEYYWGASKLVIHSPSAPHRSFVVKTAETSVTTMRTHGGLGSDRWMADEAGIVHGGMFVEPSADGDIIVTLCEKVLYGKCDAPESDVLCLLCIADMVPS